MSCELLEVVRRLSDDELVSSLKTLVGRERETTAELVAHVAELDTRDLHLKAGYGSLFVYCRDALLLSEHEAYNRIEAARVARRFPLVLEMLAEGSVNLTTVRLLARHLTEENHRSVLEAARGKKKTEVEEIVAGLWPQPDAPPLVRRLPVRPVVSGGPPPASSLIDRGTSEAPAPVVPVVAPSRPVGPVPFRPPAVTTSLAPDRYKVQFTIGTQTLEKLRLAKDMLRHAIPSGDEAAILDRALTVLLAELARKKFAATEKPRPGAGATPGGRHVPAEVRRAVWLRDGGQCAFVGTEGRRCGARVFLEFHHVKPWAVGGEPTVENIQLRCRRHNGYESKVYFDRPLDGGGLVRERGARSGTSWTSEGADGFPGPTSSSFLRAAFAPVRAGPGGTRCGPPRAGPGGGRSDLRRGGGGP
jgi:HNH endonuclease